MGSISIPTAILVAGAAATAGSVASGAIGSSAAQSAAGTQAAAADRSTALQEAIFNKEQGNLAPYIGTGDTALSKLSSIYNGTADSSQISDMLSKYPGYQFTLNQGELGLDRSQAARGLLNSGGTIKDAQSFASGLASGQWTNYLSGLSSLAGLGQNSAAGAGYQGIQAGANIGQTIQAAGTASAAGTVGSANALSSGLTGLTGGLNNSLLMYGLANNPNGPFGNTGLGAT